MEFSENSSLTKSVAKFAPTTSARQQRKEDIRQRNKDRDTPK